MSKIIDRKWQLLPIVTLSISMFIGIYFFYITLERLAHQSVLETSRSILSDVIYEIEEDSPDFSSSKLIDDYIGELTQASASTRITVIDVNGIVVGDTSLSDRALSTVENHGDRPEFELAYSNGFGSDVRFSSVLSVYLFYYAEKVFVDGRDYIITLSVPMHSLKSMTTHLMTILGVMTFLSISVLIGTSVMSHRVILTSVNQEKSKQDQRIHQRTIEIELLHRLANMLAACNNLMEAQKVVSDIIPRILGDVNGSVSLMRSSRNLLNLQLEWGRSWPGSRSFSPEECWALRKGGAHLSNDEFHNLSCEHMSGVEQNQTLCIPLTAHGNTIGMLHLYFGSGDVKVNDVTYQLAFSVAEHLGLALANLSLQEKLRSQALSDPLTGLFNRRFFEQSMDELILKSDRDNQELSLLMLDLDHFKRFNDNFGHDAGDYVLKEISLLLKHSVIEEEVVCRLGGEELAILLPNYTNARANEFAEKICRSVRDMHLELKGLSLGQLTVSIGIATYPSNALDAESVVKHADKALYKAKEQGRDRVVSYQHMNDASHLDQDISHLPNAKKETAS